MKKTLARRRGQGMTEYVILVGLIAILLVVSVETFKNKLEETFTKSAKSINDHVAVKIQ
jgi:Flp pilus assembly pilin Flp